MKQVHYTEDFECVWQAYKSCCFPAQFGSKFEAFTQWCKIIPAPDPSCLIEAILTQKRNDKYHRSKNEFVPIWKHFCRWIKYRCWEDVVDIQAEIETKKNQLKEEKAKNKKEPHVWSR